MKVISELFAFVAMVEGEDEGIPGIQTSQGWLPLVGADMVRVDQLRPTAIEMAKYQNYRLDLKRFKLVQSETLYLPVGKRYEH